MAQVATRMIYGKSPANAPVSKTLAPLAAKFQRETPCFWSYSIRPLGHCRNSKTECQNSTPFSRFFLSNFGLLFNFRVLYEDYFFKVIQVGARISKTYTATEPGQFRGLWLVSFHCQSTVAKVGQRAAVVYWAIWRISIVGPTLPSGYNHEWRRYKSKGNILRLNVLSASEWHTWLRKFETASNEISFGIVLPHWN